MLMIAQWFECTDCVTQIPECLKRLQSTKVCSAGVMQRLLHGCFRTACQSALPQARMADIGMNEAGQAQEVFTPLITYIVGQ